MQKRKLLDVISTTLKETQRLHLQTNASNYDTYPSLASGGSEIASVILNSSLLAGFPAVCAGGK